jgi:hypothetical protein
MLQNVRVRLECMLAWHIPLWYIAVFCQSGWEHCMWHADILNSFYNASLLKNTLFQFHIEVIVTFLIKISYLCYVFIFISNYHDSSTFSMLIGLFIYSQSLDKCTHKVWQTPPELPQYKFIWAFKQRNSPYQLI